MLMEIGRPIPLDYAPAPPSREANVVRGVLEGAGTVVGCVLAMIGNCVLTGSILNGSPRPAALLVMGAGVLLHKFGTRGTIRQSVGILLDPSATRTATAMRLPQFGGRGCRRGRRTA